MSISSQLEIVRRKIPSVVTLVAVSKTKPAKMVLEAYNSGQRIFGENRIQELEAKWKELPKDIKWHMIGHLQSKKVKQIAPFISMIHSVDSAKLLSVIDDSARKNNRVIDVLLQFHIAEESSKFGLTMKEAKLMLDSERFEQMQHVNVCGVMGMATFSKDMEMIRKEFKKLKFIFDEMKLLNFSEKSDFNQLSMGMSGDFEIAIEEGSTMVRVGSTIFGERL
ncbi:MAG: pyridoxal phosphate enzyme (YggS family) [Granulosicoccus sp.]|jgi:pyridoxal phosphate enzyme (YggS family)